MDTSLHYQFCSLCITNLRMDNDFSVHYNNNYYNNNLSSNQICGREFISRQHNVGMWRSRRSSWPAVTAHQSPPASLSLSLLSQYYLSIRVLNPFTLKRATIERKPEERTDRGRISFPLCSLVTHTHTNTQGPHHTVTVHQNICIS